jgi:hypothetical protein
MIPRIGPAEIIIIFCICSLPIAGVIALVAFLVSKALKDKK